MEIDRVTLQKVASGQVSYNGVMLETIQTYERSDNTTNI